MKISTNQILAKMNKFLQEEIKNLNEKKELDYPFYVINIKTNKIASGWEFKEDAQDFINDIKETHPDKVKDLKIYSKAHLQNKLKIDFLNKNNWYNV